MSQILAAPFDTEGRRAQMFPALTKTQLARVSAFGAEETYEDGRILFEQGDRDYPIYVVLEGEIEVVSPRGAVEDPIVVHTAGQFTGEVNTLASRPSLVRGRARRGLRALRIERERFRSLLQTDAELGEVVMRAFILRRLGLLSGGLGGVVLIGSRHTAATLRAQEFLVRNGHPYRYVDVDTDSGVAMLLEHAHVGVSDIPILLCGETRVLKNPSDAEIAECLGLNEPLEPGAVHDVVICGAGPSGLAAAVYAASEGLDVLIVEAHAPGGQAASSSKIENYLGFPTGISGQALAGRALAQAEKFGAKIVVARGAVTLNCDGSGLIGVELPEKELVRARAVVIATGAEYRKLDVPNLAKFEGTGVYYAATFVEAQRCDADEVIVVGGGNSAGQAATYLARSSRHVHLLVRGPDLASSMSRYLIRRIEETPNITLRRSTKIVALDGDDHLERVTWRDGDGKESTHPIRHVFTMAGASPNTAWLNGRLATDENDFICTGSELTRETLAQREWPLARAPYLFETSRPRIFAVGDVRANNVKRVASAVGEGSVCIQLVHKVISE